ncbi:uncharacterized protein LOC133194990 [Saccostrea echinata]|uniref:uncharacterized protein LOC133194990 n=1 Tax=Saccostrea echinata TaxID=191078 RepID=UPI002A7FF82C|nr:uncharacterized protein LOC133194990 [Saccostrea echinata]
MSIKLKKTIREKIEDIKNQRDVIFAFLDEFVAEAESKAESLLSMRDTGQFNQRYVEVMQHLDRCYNTFVLLSAEAEEKIGGGGFYKEENDRLNEEIDDALTGATSLSNSGPQTDTAKKIQQGTNQCQLQTNTLCQSQPKKTDSHSLTRNNVNLSIPSNTVSNSSSKNVTSYDKSVQKDMKTELILGDGTLEVEKVGIMESKNIDFAAFNPHTVSTLDVPQTLGEVYDDGDVNLNKEVNKPTCVKGVFNVVKPEHKTTKTDPDDHSAERFGNFNEKKGPLCPSADSDSIEGMRTGKPKLDIEVARRFLQGVIHQANVDNLKLDRENKRSSEIKQEKDSRTDKEEELVVGKSLKSNISVDKTKGSSVFSRKLDPSTSKIDNDNIRVKHSQSEEHHYKTKKNNETEHSKDKPQHTSMETEKSGDTKQKEIVTLGSGLVNEEIKENERISSNFQENSQSKSRTVVLEDNEVILEQFTKMSQAEESQESEIISPKSDSEKQSTSVKCVSNDDLSGETQVKSSQNKPDGDGASGEDVCKPSNLSSQDSKAKKDSTHGPDLSYEVLENSKIHSVIVSEAMSPWSFYVQKFTSDLDDLMKDLRSLQDLDPVINLQQGMVCLAKFSKDSCYYRAKVVEICSQGSDPSVEVLFVDYGNGESRKQSHLRSLPQKCASLPAQGILCALTQVAPDNKYKIWTEEAMTLFSQLVSGRRFNCMPYYVSEEPFLPSVVGLFFNIPEQIIKDGNIVLQPGPKQISIHEYIIEKGLAKSISLEDQLQLLNCSPVKEEPKDCLKKDWKGLPSSDSEDSKKQREGHKMSVECKSKVNIGSSVETLSDSTHSVPRLPKSSTRDERERKTKAEKERREARAKQKRKECQDKSQVKPSKNEEVNSKEASKSSVKKHRDKGQVEETSDSAGPVCSTPNDKDEDHNNLNAEKTQDKKTVQESVQNITEIKIQNVVDDSVSVKSSSESESQITTYTVDKTVNLPSKINVDKSGLMVMLSHVESPSNFYVHLVSELSAKTIDHLHLSLNKTMEQMSRKQLQKMSKSFQPSVGDLCCVLFSEDNQYYRGLVTKLEMTSPTKASGNKTSGPEYVGKVHIFYIDFGNREVVPKRKLFPLPQQYADLPSLAVHVSLAYIQPYVSRGSPKKEEQWSKEAVQKFISITGFDSAMSMIIVEGGDIQKMLGNHPSVVVEMPPLQVLLVDTSIEEEDVCVNMDLIRLSLARLCAVENPSKDTPTSEPPSVASPDEMKDWNPMLDDYMDVRNSYKVDVDDAGVATIGIKVQDEKRICKYYQKNKCWRGDKCPYRHVIVAEGALTGDVDYVYGDVMEEYHQDDLPDPGSWIACEVSTILNPSHFYIVLPFGKEPLASLEPAKKEEGYSSFQQETLEDLMASLQEFYGGKQFEGSYVDYAPGEMVVARYSVDLQWYRARVISSGDRKVEVFYVDFGNKEFVSDKSVRNIDPQFLHLPLQALECFLVDIEPVGGTDRFSQEARMEFRKLVDGKTLVAYIKSRSWSGCAWIELFDTSGEEDISIARTLIDQGLAQESTALSSTTSGRGSNTSSRVSSQESLILVPG